MLDQLVSQQFILGTFNAFTKTSFLGRRLLKLPSDLWVIQEIISETRPRTIVEVGAATGASALFYGMLQAVLGGGPVITVDLQDCEPSPAFTHVRGDCQNVFPYVASLVEDPTMVILDCCHERDHVLRELGTYGTLVSPGQYLVVEDTSFKEGDFLDDSARSNAGAAVQTWLPQNPTFVVDETREKWLLTYNHGGFLKRTL